MGQLEYARAFWRSRTRNARYAIVLCGAIGALGRIALGSESVKAGEGEFTQSSYSYENSSSSSGYAPPPRATDPEFSDEYSSGSAALDTERASALSEEASDLMGDINVLASTSTTPCVDVLLIRPKVEGRGRSWTSSGRWSSRPSSRRCTQGRSPA